MNLLQLLRGRRREQESDLEHYVRGGRRPWSRGYEQYKEAFLTHCLADPAFLADMRNNTLIPGYGEFLDERVVEYPWLLSRLDDAPGRLLDAGSTLNRAFVLEHPCLKQRELTLVTLAPESQCFWQLGVSYVFADLRDLPFQTGWFDEVVSISTLEHVGKDNSLLYARDLRHRENDGTAYLRAVRELRRVCRAGGKVYVTVPFGRFTDFGWYQQFDAGMVDCLVEAFAPARHTETYFRYHAGGWQFSDREACSQCEGFDIHATRYMSPFSTADYDPDQAAASRAVAALELWKGAA